MATEVADATFAGTLPAIVRTEDHRYFYQGEGPFPSVTGILDVMGKLVITDSVKEAGRLGSLVHEMAQLVVEGKPTPSMEPKVRSRVLHYAKWWEASGWKLRLAEAAVIRAPNMEDRTPYGYGGTLDLLAYDRDGRTVLADVKTGSLYQKAILQVAAYGMAEYIAPLDGPTAYRMPLVDRYVILHVTEDQCREVEVSVGSSEQMAFLACLDVYQWMQQAKGRRL